MNEPAVGMRGCLGEGKAKIAIATAFVARRLPSRRGEKSLDRRRSVRAVSSGGLAFGPTTMIPRKERFTKYRDKWTGRMGAWKAGRQVHRILNNGETNGERGNQENLVFCQGKGVADLAYTFFFYIKTFLFDIKLKRIFFLCDSGPSAPILGG